MVETADLRWRDAIYSSANLKLLAAVEHRGAEPLEEAEPHTLAHLAFPREHGRWVRTNNVQKRKNCESRRRTKVEQEAIDRKSRAA